MPLGVEDVCSRVRGGRFAFPVPMLVPGRAPVAHQLSGLLLVQRADRVMTAEAACGAMWLGSQTAPQLPSPSVAYLKDIHYILHVLDQGSKLIQVNEYKQYYKICFEGGSRVHALLLSSCSTHENKSR